MPLEKASRKNNKLKLAIYGKQNCGKTYTGINFANLLVGDKTGVLDTESGASMVYCDGKPFDFYMQEILPYSPEVFRDGEETYKSLVKPFEDALTLFEKEGLKAVVIDSCSLLWETFQSVQPKLIPLRPTKNNFDAWGQMGRHHERFIRRLLTSPMHVIVTYKEKPKIEGSDSKDPVAQTAKQALFKFNTVMHMNDGVAKILSGPPEMKGGKTFRHPGKKELDQIMTWLNGGVNES